MLFNSVAFVAFFFIVFFVYWFVLKNNYKWQNYFLLTVSCVFYMAFIPVYILILALTILIDYTAAIYIEKSEGKKRKSILILSIVCTCLVLFVFKYFNFFNANFSLLAGYFHLHYPVPMINLILPIGLSFHTFQSLSYVIEVYRGNQKTEKNFLVYSLYVMFFPQLVAGPIERAEHLLPQFNRPRSFDYTLASAGAKMILLGYFKKVVIADNVAPLVNAVYNSPADYIGFPMVVATVLFAFQLYCDFSGYSDIAIGTARLLGFNLMTNFDRPFISKNVTEFWRRWHISLSTWLRDYLFSPIALATRNWGQAGILFSMLTTFLIAGLWHGAGWNFIIFGLLQGIALCYDLLSKKFRKKISKALPVIVYSTVSIFLTFTFECFTFIFFRAKNIADAKFIVLHAFSDIADYTNFFKLYVKFRGMGLEIENVLQPVIFIFMLLLIEFLNSKNLLQSALNKRPIYKWAFYYLILLIIVFWGYENTAQNFIYFQF